jgi:hypothetical protein
MNRPTDEEIMRALCCGGKCECEYGYCHAYDFKTEAKRVRALLEVSDGHIEERRSSYYRDHASG